MPASDDLLAIGIIFTILAAVGIPLYFLVRWIVFKVNGEAARSPNVDRKTVVSFLRDRLFNRREGQIVFWGSIIYMILFASSKAIFTERAWFSFALWMGAYMPLFLTVFYIKMGGFNKTYESTKFNIIFIGVIAMIPIIVTVSSNLGFNPTL